MRDLAAGVDAGVGAAGDGQPRGLGQPQRRAPSASSSVCLDGAQPRLGRPAGEVGAVVGEVESQAYDSDEPAVPCWGGGLVVACVGAPGQPASSALPLAASSASAWRRPRWRRPRWRRPRCASSPRRQRPRPEPRRLASSTCSDVASASASASSAEPPSAAVSSAAVSSAAARQQRSSSAAVAAVFFAAAFLAGAFFAVRLVAASASPTAACRTVSASTSSMTAMGALSPLRGPTLVMRV